ncbi:molybdenum cofactor guanylyltransferase MobA [Kaistia terrae]|uniref:Molybdenum cofactor guanylyltransferase n=1 Tax=Kaistia terrae TaxID=537017 RepID=A0ABW0PTW0_9HYPH|nr:molybdenum cofactor guanylyltransferase MobA [Kaistia terrae]MCX5577494.1 molybdenum cofactor guanylyltransferase MobA [Kaistia terrae]
MTIAGLILAGGNSQRMGSEKAFVRLGGRPLIEHAIERLAPQVDALAINANGNPARFDAYRVPVLADDRADTGPLAGVLAGLRWAETLPTRPEFVATIPIDTPFFPADLVARLDAGRSGQPRIAIAASGERDHPVVGLWPVALADTLQEWRQTARSQGVRAFLASCGFTVITFELPLKGPDPFLNLNTPEERDEADAWLSNAHSS